VNMKSLSRPEVSEVEFGSDFLSSGDHSMVRLQGVTSTIAIVPTGAATRAVRSSPDRDMDLEK
jgi:hypothetical protein